MQLLHKLSITALVFVIVICSASDVIPTVAPTKSTLSLTLLNNRHYYFSDDLLSWTDAQNFCRLHNLKLVALETEEENQLVVEHLDKTQRYRWIGGTDEGTEDHWRWSGSNQDLDYTNWRPGQPNGGTAENCMYLCWDGDATWCDMPCHLRLRFVCEENSA